MTTTTIPDYRGCTIKRCPIGFEWVHEDTFDAEIDEGTYRSTGAGYGDSPEDCHAEIDEYLAELGETAPVLEKIESARQVCRARWNTTDDVVWRELSDCLRAIHQYIKVRK